MKLRDSKYVSASRPVNSRTASKANLAAEQINPLVHERLRARKLKNRFGAPLSRQLRISTQTRLRPVMMAGGMLTAVSALGLLLATIQASMSVAAGAGVGMLLGAGLLFLGRQQQAGNGANEALAPSLFNDADLRAFDQALEMATQEVPDNIAAALAELKQQILRIARLASDVGTDENFTLDDKYYVAECLRRYLPDSLQSYLRVPSNVRVSQAIEGEHTAADLLLQQIALLQAELRKREISLNKSAATLLVRQQRFLEAKERE